MRARVRTYLDNCLQCLTYSVPAGKPKDELYIYDKSSFPFDTIHVDHYGSLEKTDYSFIFIDIDYSYIFIVVDAFIKYILLYPVRSTATKKVIAAVTQLFHDLGLCRRLVSDRGTAFTSDAFAQFLECFGIEHVRVIPRANGQVERINWSLRSTVAKIVGTDSWYSIFSRAHFVINNKYVSQGNQYYS